MRKEMLIAAATLCSLGLRAGDIPVKSFRYSGPFVVKAPVMVDSVDVNKKAFSTESLLNTPVSLLKAGGGSVFSGALAPASDADNAIHLLQFQLTNSGYTKATVKVGKMKSYQLFVDGKESNGDLNLLPATHDIVVKYLSHKGDKDSLQVVISADNEKLLLISDGTKRQYTLADVLNGKHFGGTSLSADGRYLITKYNDVVDATTTLHRWQLSDLKSGNLLLDTDRAIEWIPGTCSYFFVRKSSNGRQIVAVDAATGKERVVANGVPESRFVFSPTSDYLIVSREVKGPQDDADVHQFISPDDRMPGWRNRNVLEKFDLATGLVQPLTFGYNNVSLLDISRDGRYVLYMVSRQRLEKRPTTLFSIRRLDLHTMTDETLVAADGFIGDAQFSPDGKSIAVVGSPEAFNGIGKNLPADRTPSMVDNQIFILDIASRNVVPLTRDFNPSVEQMQWNVYDNLLYFTALDRDCKHLYRADVKSGKILSIAEPEEYMGLFALADNAPVMTFSGQSASNTDRLFRMDLKSLKPVLLDDLHAVRFGDVEFGKCEAWDFVNSRGDTICGRYYLPPHFDPSKKYPLIVNYYGGCSPTSRYFESRYPHHLYAAMGYVVYVVQPSGATGFGQEFSSRHVNTAGEGPAQDIIEGTKQFCRDHSFVDTKKIGCIGASYGGFMTQYLQTKTDIFAAAVSHAGISDHTSYWGEGYWGYSYSEVSMANSYPWTDQELYVNRSPLFHADKIHTPLLFVHGMADHNVPVGESIQMYNALRLLNRPTAFVVVEGEDHHILTYDKRIKWQNTIFAWFAKWLQDDSSWWDSMYDKMPE
ncbi:MAG: prolyl oligopeptidase family serine peptidase [Prevotella sp.]